jgi:hypothetical protein
MFKKNKRKRKRKKEKPIESLFEPNANWKDVKRYFIIDVFQIVLETEYEIVEQRQDIKMDDFPS